MLRSTMPKTRQRRITKRTTLVPMFVRVDPENRKWAKDTARKRKLRSVASLINGLLTAARTGQ